MTSPVLLLTLKQARIKNAKQNIIYFFIYNLDLNKTYPKYLFSKFDIFWIL